MDGYLSIEHINSEKPCPLVFLAMDIASRDPKTKETYSNVYKNMNKIILEYAGAHSLCTKESVISLTAMIIGAVAIARTIDDQSLVKDILSSCRQQARLILGEAV